MTIPTFGGRVIDQKSPITYDGYREFYGEPGKVRISPESEGYVDDIMRDFDQYTEDNRFKDALRHSIGKEAEMAERFGIPTDRVIKGLTIRPTGEVEREMGFGGSYNPLDDVIRLQIHGYSDLFKLYEPEDYYALLHGLVAHENAHRELFGPLGRAFERAQQRDNQFDAATVTFNPLNLFGPQGIPVYRRPYERGFSEYGARRGGTQGYPEEEIPEISRFVASRGFQGVDPSPHLRKALRLKRQMLRSMHKRGVAEIPDPKKDLYDDVYSGHGTYTPTPAMEQEVTGRVVVAMQNLAAAQELLRNKLAILQNQNAGLRWLTHSKKNQPELADAKTLLDRNKFLGITAPAFDKGYDEDAFIEGARFPVKRKPDPIMHREAENKLYDKKRKMNVNGIWPLEIGDFGRSLYKKQN